MNEPHVVVIASTACDEIVVGREVAIRPGGPAQFLARALDALAARYTIVTNAQPIRVRITVDGSGEHGVVGAVPPIVVPASLEGDATIVSTILDEVSLDCIPWLPGFVAVDLQGYVRAPSGRRRRLDVDPTTISRIDCAKATAEELQWVDAATIAVLRERILIVTCGATGVRVWDHGVLRVISVDPVAARNAIGAGDTFLAAFTVAVLRGAAVHDAAIAAAQYVHDWLVARG